MADRWQGGRLPARRVDLEGAEPCWYAAPPAGIVSHRSTGRDPGAAGDRIMPTDSVLYETRGPVAVLTLNRPDKLNAIDANMVAELGRALDRAEEDAAVLAVVLRGAGRAFSAGFDLNMGEGEGLEFVHTELHKDFDIIMRFWDFPKPTVAAVHTWCLGSGMEMAVACDVTVAGVGCRFGAPEVRFGSGAAASWRSSCPG
jgi:enoyl-CoA hydratase